MNLFVLGLMMPMLLLVVLGVVALLVLTIGMIAND